MDYYKCKFNYNERIEMMWNKLKTFKLVVLEYVDVLFLI